MGCTASKLSVSQAQVDIATGNNNNNRDDDDDFHSGRILCVNDLFEFDDGPMMLPLSEYVCDFNANDLERNDEYKCNEYDSNNTNSYTNDIIDFVSKLFPAPTTTTSKTNNSKLEEYEGLQGEQEEQQQQPTTISSSSYKVEHNEDTTTTITSRRSHSSSSTLIPEDDDDDDKNKIELWIQKKKIPTTNTTLNKSNKKGKFGKKLFQKGAKIMAIPSSKKLQCHTTTSNTTTTKIVVVEDRNRNSSSSIDGDISISF